MAISESLPISEPLAVPLQLEAQVRRDPEFSGVPEPIHLLVEGDSRDAVSDWRQ